MIWLGVLTTVAVLALDQISKWWILTEVMQPPRLIEVTGFLNLVLVWNYGVSFGLFANDAEGMRWVLIAVALAISAVLAVWMVRARTRFQVLSLALVIGGALGNVVDRLVHGAVADFVDVHLFGYHWPAFNVADTGITVGVALLLLDSFRQDRRS